MLQEELARTQVVKLKWVPRHRNFAEIELMNSLTRLLDPPVQPRGLPRTKSNTGLSIFEQLVMSKNNVEIDSVRRLQDDKNQYPQSQRLRGCLTVIKEPAGDKSLGRSSNRPLQAAQTHVPSLYTYQSNLRKLLGNRKSGLSLLGYMRQGGNLGYRTFSRGISAEIRSVPSLEKLVNSERSKVHIQSIGNGKTGLAKVPFRISLRVPISSSHPLPLGTNLHCRSSKEGLRSK